MQWYTEQSGPFNYISVPLFRPGTVITQMRTLDLLSEQILVFLMLFVTVVWRGKTVPKLAHTKSNVKEDFTQIFRQKIKGKRGFKTRRCRLQ